ncbi:unnamed protein product [Amoebophrya sp. A25]|nr:unnamed protein product [Amoebophrya sp. A25]|eukprot:GSA25T00014027001.1
MHAEDQSMASLASAPHSSSSKHLMPPTTGMEVTQSQGTSKSPSKKSKAVFQEFHEEAALSRRKSSVEGGFGFASKRRQSIDLKLVEDAIPLPILKRRNSIEQVMEEMDAKERQRDEELQVKAASRRKSLAAAQDASPNAQGVHNTLQSLIGQLQKSKNTVNAAYMGLPV